MLKLQVFLDIKIEEYTYKQHFYWFSIDCFALQVAVPISRNLKRLHDFHGNVVL